MKTQQFHDELTKLFEAIATNNKAIAHTPELPRFFTEDQEMISTNLPSPVIFCPPPISKIVGNLDNAIQKYEFDLWILFSCEDNKSVIDEARKAAEQIALDFVSVLEFKAGSWNGPNQKELGSFSLSDCQIDVIGPVYTSMYGVSLTVMPGSLRNLIVNNDNWIIPYE